MKFTLEVNLQILYCILFLESVPSYNKNQALLFMQYGIYQVLQSVPCSSLQNGA